MIFEGTIHRHLNLYKHVFNSLGDVLESITEYKILYHHNSNYVGEESKKLTFISTFLTI